MLSGLLSRKSDKTIEERPLKVVVFGDSHCNRFALGNQLTTFLPSLRRIELNLNAISGATILGMGKRNSTLGVQAKIESLLTGAEDAVVFNFGQVDIELGYYYRVVVKDEHLVYEDFVARLVETYIPAIKALAKLGGLVVVKGVNLSVLTHNRHRAIQYTSRIIAENVQDPDLKKRYAKTLAAVLPNAPELDRRHLQFNRVLMRACALADLEYYDINNYLADPATGRVRLEFVPQAFDHHVPATVGVHLAYWRPVAALLAEREAVTAI